MAIPPKAAAGERHERAREASASDGEQRLRNLMVEYQGGSLEAFEILYGQLAPDLHRYLRSMIRTADGAEDLLQETFLQMHRSRAAYHPAYPVRPWVFGLARNVFLMKARAGRRWTSLHDVRARVPDTPVRPDMDRLELVDEIRHGTRGLPPDQAEAIALHYEYGFSFNEIAGMLGISAAAVRARASRGAARFRHAVEVLRRAIT
ncbi:MAG: RNA polymerase sigma factor [Acidobacteria bacterium]|nr:RNA polymerase sigma factor [Acidobacteriota bacterium]